MNVETTGSKGSIELFGLCGAGKTTIVGDLLWALNNHDKTTRYKLEKPVVPDRFSWFSSIILFSLRLAFRDPLTLVRLMSDRAGRWLLMKIGYRIAGLQMRTELERVVLLDSGVLQPLISFNVEYNFSLMRINEEVMLQILPLPSCAVYVRIPVEVAMQRYLQREYEGARPVRENNIIDRFRMGHCLAERLYDRCKLLGLRTAVYDSMGLTDINQLERIADGFQQEKI